MTPKISIITPVYKAEKFLCRCVDSIIAQTYTNWELILVDDGSPDKSAQICDDYAKADNRIKVIHKPNGGVSSARQAGLVASTGDFVIHADSDDWLAPNMLELLIEHANKTDADVIVVDFYRVSKDKEQRIIQQPTSLDHSQVLKDIIGGHLYASCWNKLIRKNVIMNSNARFPKGINLGEDKCFLAQILKNDTKVSYLPEALYYYDDSINDGSLVRQISMTSIEDGFRMVKYLESLLEEKYSSSIFEVKRRLKIRAIKSGLFTDNESNSIYREINKQLIVNVVTWKVHMNEDLMLFFFSLGLFKIAKRIKY